MQLPLDFVPAPDATFATFIGGDNAELVAAMQALASKPGDNRLFLHGPGGVGKSHLLQAACAATGRTAYLPLGELVASARGPEVTEGLERLQLVAFDDVECLAGRHAWQAAFLEAIDRLRSAGSAVVLSGCLPPADSGIELPDLVSRLQAATIYSLRPLRDEALAQLLRSRAGFLGLPLEDEVVDYLLKHAPREAAALVSLVRRVERESLAAHRRVTVPFVRSLLAMDD